MDMPIKVFDYEKKFVITHENALEYADKIGAFLKERLCAEVSMSPEGPLRQIYFAMVLVSAA